MRIRSAHLLVSVVALLAFVVVACGGGQAAPTAAPTKAAAPAATTAPAAPAATTAPAAPTKLPRRPRPPLRRPPVRHSAWVW